MMKENHKANLQYIGIPIICLIYLIFNFNEKYYIILLLNEMLLIFGYIASLIDIKSKTIPNKLILIMIGAWLLIMALMVLIDTELAVLMLKDSILGFIIGGGLFLIVYLISRKGLGGGDVKFIAATGLYIGFARTISVILYGSILATLFVLILLLLKKIGRKDPIPLVPFLYAGILITMFYG